MGPGESPWTGPERLDAAETVSGTWCLAGSVTVTGAGASAAAVAAVAADAAHSASSPGRCAPQRNVRLCAVLRHLRAVLNEGFFVGVIVKQSLERFGRGAWPLRGRATNKWRGESLHGRSPSEASCWSWDGGDALTLIADGPLVTPCGWRTAGGSVSCIDLAVRVVQLQPITIQLMHLG